MNVYEHAEPGALRPRTHPWVDSERDAAHRYYDFRREPALIRSALEDFVGLSAHPAVETFYRLIEWMSSSASVLESNDCAFTAPAIDAARETDPVVCSGRLMFFFRELAENTSPEQMRWLTQAVARALSRADPELEGGAVGLTLASVVFTVLPSDAQRGEELLLSFWAWGDDEAETMANLDRTLLGITAALREVSDAIRDAA